MENKKVLNISKKTFLVAIIVLISLIVVSTILTYILPKGHFAVIIDGNGQEVIDYSTFISVNSSGISILKAIASPILIFFSQGAIQPIMLMLFLIIIGGVFQIMFSCGGMGAIVNRVVKISKNKKFLFLAIISLFFMAIGSFFGLFEETLVLLPMIVAICLSLGYDNFVAFIICMLSAGFGFSVSITNPFTIIYSSNIINANPMSGVWLRLILFAVLYSLILLFLFVYTKKHKTDAIVLEENQKKFSQPLNDKKVFITYTIFLSIAFLSILLFTSTTSLRDLSTPLLAVVFLIGGLISGFICAGVKNTFKQFLSGVISALPAIAMISLAFAVKYVLTEGQIIDTVTNSITTAISGKSPYLTVLILFGIILVLEFFISSSTAKAVFVMGVMLGAVNSGALAISKELLVLIYILSDGFTNVLFPTSPTLLIGLSMVNQNYGEWIKKSKFLFIITFLICIAVLMFAVAINY